MATAVYLIAGLVLLPAGLAAVTDFRGYATRLQRWNRRVSSFSPLSDQNEADLPSWFTFNRYFAGGLLILGGVAALANAIV